MSFASLQAATNTRAIKNNTPIGLAIPGRESEMVANNGGGVSFVVDDWTRLERFLILGSEGGTYYASERKLNQSNVEFTKTLIQNNGNRVVDACVQISQAGRARNNDYALLVLAMVLTFGNDSVKRYAAASLPLVARTGTHLMHFVGFANGMRGWGKILKRAIQNWYAIKDSNSVAYQAIKYQQRDGWSQRDIIRLSHLKAGEDVVRNNVYKYIVNGASSLGVGDEVPQIIAAFEEAKTASVPRLCQLITENRMGHEMIPNERKNEPAVWEALYQSMGTTALIRNLNKFTALGLVSPFSALSKDITVRLNDVEKLRKDKIHPLQMLIAMRQYCLGHGDKGSLVWTPNPQITAALESGFYQSFEAVVPSGKNMMLNLDVSGSMDSPCLGMPLTCREGASVMAMVTARTEHNSIIFGFDHKFRDLGILATDNLETVLKKTYSRNFGSTDCGLPARHALEQKWDVDGFTIYTDNEVNTGRNHPTQALNNYRKGMNKPQAKLISCAMVLNNFTIADPKDRYQVDVCGFDTTAPSFISQFMTT